MQCIYILFYKCNTCSPVFFHNLKVTDQHNMYCISIYRVIALFVCYGYKIILPDLTVLLLWYFNSVDLTPNITKTQTVYNIQSEWNGKQRTGSLRDKEKWWSEHETLTPFKTLTGLVSVKNSVVWGFFCSDISSVNAQQSISNSDCVLCYSSSQNWPSSFRTLRHTRVGAHPQVQSHICRIYTSTHEEKTRCIVMN